MNSSALGPKMLLLFQVPVHPLAIFVVGEALYFAGLARACGLIQMHKPKMVERSTLLHWLAIRTADDF
jgi:hypothetical protein